VKDNDGEGKGGGIADPRAGQTPIGWVGTGRMGAELARRLIAAGCDVTVYNRTVAKAEPLLALGAKAASSIAELGSRPIVFLSVGSSDDLLAALLGRDGLMSGRAVPRVVVDCSTVSASASARAREELAGRGTALLAAPVMGNPKVVRAGQMTAAVSGPRSAFDFAAPYLDLLGRGTTYVGDGEAARTVKLCHNLLLGVVAQSLAEITVLAEKSGISRHAFLDCLNKSVLGSLFTGYKTPAYVNLDFEPTFTATLLRKDFDLGLAAARDHEVPMPVASAVYQLIQGLVGRGYGDADFAALLRQQADSAGLSLESEHAAVSDGLDADALYARRSGLLAGERQAVPDRDDYQVDPLIRRGVVVEVADGDHDRVIVAGVDDAAVRERVVHHDQPARLDPRHDLAPVTQVPALVRVDEREVELLGARQRAERVDGGAQSQLDLVRQARLLPVLPGQRGPFLVDVAAGQVAVIGEPPGDADRRVAGERAHLDRRAGRA
jgi:3-hydroxyisobutyrate dehydrogenase